MGKEENKRPLCCLFFFFFIRISPQISPWHVNADNAYTDCKLILMTGSTSGLSQTQPKTVVSLNKDMWLVESCGEGAWQLRGLQHPAAPVLDLCTRSSSNPHPEQTSWERWLHAIHTPSHSSLTLFSLTNPNTSALDKKHWKCQKPYPWQDQIVPHVNIHMPQERSPSYYRYYLWTNQKIRALLAASWFLCF